MIISNVRLNFIKAMRKLQTKKRNRKSRREFFVQKEMEARPH